MIVILGHSAQSNTAKPTRSGVTIGRLTFVTLLVITILTTMLPRLCDAQIKINDVSDNSITISWLAPGDDGTWGTATAYEIRFDTAPITPLTWAAASNLSQNVNGGPKVSHMAE